MTEQEAKDKWLEITEDKYGGWCRLNFRTNTAEFYWEFGTPDKPNPRTLLLVGKNNLFENFDVIAREVIERVDGWVKWFNENKTKV
jgi:hypothetical protein